MKSDDYETLLKDCDWPDGKGFSVQDDIDEHLPCYVHMPCGGGIAFHHHAVNGVDQARAQFVADACNAWLAVLRANGQCNEPRERVAGTLRDDAQAMRELGIDSSVPTNMETAADMLAPNAGGKP